MKAIIILNYASEEDIGKKTSIRLKNDEYGWIEEVVIKPIPEKNTWDITKNGHVTEYAEGWNACLDEIFGD